MDLLLRSFRFKAYDYPQTLNFYNGFLQMTIDQHYLAPFKATVCFQYTQDDVALRFEFPRIPQTTVYDNGQSIEITNGLYKPYMSHLSRLAGLHGNQEDTGSSAPYPTYTSTASAYSELQLAARRPPSGLLASPYGPVARALDDVSITIYTSDIDALVERGRQMSFEPIIGPRIINSLVKSCLYLDPNGVRVYIYQVRGQPVRPDLEEPSRDKAAPSNIPNSADVTSPVATSANATKGGSRARDKSKRRAGAGNNHTDSRSAGHEDSRDSDDNLSAGGSASPSTNTPAEDVGAHGDGSSARSTDATAGSGTDTGTGVPSNNTPGSPSSDSARPGRIVSRGLHNRLGYVSVPVASLSALQRAVTFYTETCAVRHAPVTWASHAALLRQGQYTGLLADSTENKHRMLSVTKGRRAEVADVLLGAAQYSLLKEPSPIASSTSVALLGGLRGLGVSADGRGVGSFRVVDSEDIIAGARRMVWLGNHLRTRGPTLCLMYSGRKQQAVDGMHEHIRAQWGGEEQEDEMEVIQDVDALFEGAAVEASERLLHDLLRTPTPRLNYLELGADGDAGEATRQSLVPMRGHCCFLGVGFAVGSLARMMEHLAHVAPDAAQAVEITSILNMPRYVMLEDEAGIPLELADGVVALVVESRRPADTRSK